MFSRRSAPRNRAARVGNLSAAVCEALESRRMFAVDVLTYHNDIASTGANLAETTLTPANVNVSSFGKLFATTLDGQVYAQPLVATGTTIASGVNTTSGAAGVHDVIYAATQNDTLYALDAKTGAILWKRSFLDLTNSGGNQNNTAGATSIVAVPQADTGSADITPVIGITGTPVIDATNKVIYLVTKTKEVIGGKNHYVQRLHAIKMSDGTDAVTTYVICDTTGATGNNTQIYAYGTGDGSITDPYNGTGKKVVQFNALREAQRGALNLVNGTLYITWASHGDNGPYHGWVVAWDVSNISGNGMVLKGALNTSPNNGEAGIWEGGGRLAFEPDGSAFYLVTGNGTGGAPTLNASGFPTNANYNEAVIKVVLDSTSTAKNQNSNGWGMKVVDYFIPYNVNALDQADSDFGSGAPILLPALSGHPPLLVIGGKDGRLYVLNRNNLGHYDSTNDAALNSVPNGSGHNTPPGVDGGTLSTPVWYNNQLYVVGGYSKPVYAFSISTDNKLILKSQTTVGSFGYLPGSPSVSANGSTNGIVWVMDRNANRIRAYDATSLSSTELWDSGQAAGGADDVGAVVKFAVPTVANGMVYVGTTNQLVAYGLSQPATQAPKAPVLAATTLSGSSINLTWTDSTSSVNRANGYLIEQSTNGTTFTQITTAPASATSLAIGGLSANTKYYFRIRGYNAVGNSPYSNIASATTTNQTAAIDYSNGFSSGSSLVFNGSGAITSSLLRLTNGSTNAVTSVFSNTKVDITSFSTQFKFQVSGSAKGDGFTFVLQNAGLNAIGMKGGGLGYGPDKTGGTPGITKSAAIKFDFFSNQGEGGDSTGLFLNGIAPTTTGSIDLSKTAVKLNNTDVFLASMTYDGSKLSVTIKDTVTGATVSQQYTVDLATVLGGSTAYAGFTAGSGTYTAVQDIQSWTFTPATTAVGPNAPFGLGATASSATSVDLSWTTNGSNQTGFHLDRATDAGFTQNLLTQTLPGSPNTFTDTAPGIAPGGTYYYRISAFNSAGESSDSDFATVIIPVAPPKPSNQLITDVTASGISMSWQDNAGHAADGYRILRSADGGEYSIVAELPPTSRPAPSTYAWDDTNLTPGTVYSYHIVAYNVSGNNDFAGLNATTITDAPSNVTATPASQSVTLDWTAPKGAVSYNVYRGTTSGGESTTPLASGITDTTYTDNTIVSGQTYYYFVTAVNANASFTPPLPSESAASAEVTNGASNPGSGLPAGWSDADLGSTSTKGSAAFDGTTWTVAGAGADLWNGADQGNFASTQVSGDKTIIAKITSMTNTNDWAKAGVMLRDSSAAGSMYAGVFASPANGVIFQWRSATNGATSRFKVDGVAIPSASSPVWVKLVKQGTKFSAYYSTNGSTYTQITTSKTIVFANSNYLAGLAVTSHSTNTLSTTTFTNVSVIASL